MFYMSFDDMLLEIGVCVVRLAKEIRMAMDFRSGISGALSLRSLSP